MILTTRRLGFILAALVALGAGSKSFAASDEYETPQSRLEGYKPQYFLFGNPDSKIQLSTKIQLIEDHRLYFAYSQTMFWDIAEDSSPITDVNFNPEFFYRFDLSGPQKAIGSSSPDDPPGGVKSWIDFGLFEHESNGETGPKSRGWDRAYLRYVFGALWDREDPEGVRVHTSLKVWLPYDYDPYNLDLVRYRGIYELEFTLGNLFGSTFSRSDLTLRVFPGGPSTANPFSGGQELTLRFVRARDPQFVPLWTLQIFNGVGESLLNYFERRTVFRAGISF